MNYWSNEDGKKNFEQRIKNNQEIIDNELVQGFSEDIFNQGYNEESKAKVSEEYLPKTYKKAGVISRLFDMLRNIFKKNNR